MAKTPVDSCSVVTCHSIHLETKPLGASPSIPKNAALKRSKSHWKIVQVLQTGCHVGIFRRYLSTKTSWGF
jgi:hypothetical protein